MREISLDRIDYGSESENENWKRVHRVKIPSEITKREICIDIFNIAWPAILELLLTQLTSMVDLMMVGKLGYRALSAVGLTMQSIFLLIAVGIALNVGATAMIARAKGADQPQDANQIFAQAVVAMALLSAVMALLGVLFAKPLVVFMGANIDTAADATVYMKLRSVGLFFSSVTASITAALRGISESKIPMFYNLIANTINVIL